MNFMKRSVSKYIILLIISVIYLSGCIKKEEKIDNTDIIDVNIIKVTENDVFPEIRAIGNIMQKEKADITPLVSGRVAILYKDAGDKVKTGELLALLDQKYAKLALEQAKNTYQQAENALKSTELNYVEELKNVESHFMNLEKTKAELTSRENNLKETEEDLAKKQELYKAGGIPKDQLDKVNYEYLGKKKDLFVATKDLMITELGFRDKDITDAGYKIPETQVKRIEILKIINTRLINLQIEDARVKLQKADLDLKSAQIGYDETFLKSPINGVIGERFIHLGERVDEKTKLYTIIETQIVYWTVNITETDAGKIIAGNKSTFKIDALGNKNFNGNVTIISPLVDVKSRTVEIRIEVSNWNNELKPGMFGRGFIYGNAKKKEIKIPVTCLLTVQSENAEVYVVKKNRVFKRSIKIGKEQNDNVEVMDGLVNGEIIVSDPPINLMEGNTVNFIK